MRAVADTSTLVDLAIPFVSQSIDTAGNDDPLKVFLTIYDVHVPEKVTEELGELWVGSDDAVASAAELVLQVTHEMTVHDLREQSNGMADIPALEAGEIHAIHLANCLSPAPDILVTSEFGRSYDAIIQDRLDPGIICKSTPELLRDMGAAGHMDRRFVMRLLDELGDAKGWDEEYIGYLRYTLR